MKTAKAAASSVAGASTFFVGALADGFQAQDVVGAVVAGIIAFQVVYWAPKNLS